MVAFALITEGITDQVAIENIICTHYDEEHEFNTIQPVRDQTDQGRQGNHGGWELVLEYCAIDDFIENLSTNDFIIIQIDTDVCGHKNFDIPITENGADRKVDDIVNDVKKFLINKIGTELYDKFQERIIFAISVHSLECWLLPEFGSVKTEKQRVKNCEGHLQRILEKKGISYTKDYRCYLDLCKHLLKIKNLNLAKKNNRSLEIFINSLPVL